MPLPISTPTPDFVRVRQIVGRAGEPGILPVKKSTLYNWIRCGRFPAGTKVGGVTMWPRDLIISIAKGEVEQ
jgi:hypothetical protein